MADLTPEENNLPARPSSSRRKALTPEQRRLLGTPRAYPPKQPAIDLGDQVEEDPGLPVENEPPPRIRSDRSFEPDGDAVPKPRPDRQRSSAFVGETKASRHLEMQRAFIVIGVLIFLFLVFWGGRKFDRVKHLIMSRVTAPAVPAAPEKFPGLTAEELVEAALAAEKQGDWPGAAQRFLEAKRKNRNYRGLLFRIGKGNYDRGDWDGADWALEHALKFGENIAPANHLRGLIAVRRHDLPAAERFFAAAAKAEPLVSDFFYFWGETLRLDQHPREAILRYQQAIHRAPSVSDETLCQFKIRLARIEAAEAAAVRAELEEMRKAGPLSLDWLMTDAALQLHAGNIKEAAHSISEARATGPAPLFVTCAGDTIFIKASETHPEIASVALVRSPAK